MTLLEYAYGWYDAYQETKPYMTFRTFVESLKRPSNSTLIESISNGVAVIIEANLGINLGKIKNDSAEFSELIQSGDKRAILGYALPIIYRLAQAQGGEDATKTEALLTKAVDYVTDNWKKLLDYDGSTKPSTFLNTYVMRTAKSSRRLEAGQTAEVITYPHEECKAAFEDDYNGMKTKAYGTVKNPNVGNDKVLISWQTGPNEGTTTTEYIDDMVFYDIVEDSNKTVSASTPLDVNKGSGGQEETLADTAAFADTSPESDERQSGADSIIKKAIDKASVIMAEQIEPDDDAKYNTLVKVFKKYLNALTTSSENAEGSTKSTNDIGFDVNEKRKDTVMKQTRKIQNFWIVIQKVINKMESTGKLQEIDPSLIDKANGVPAGDYIKQELNKLTAAPTKADKKPANIENIKAVLGDTLFKLISGVKQADLDTIEQYYTEIQNLKENKGSLNRSNALAQKYGINEKTATELYNKFKSVAADDPNLKHYGSKKKILAHSEK